MNNDPGGFLDVVGELSGGIIKTLCVWSYVTEVLGFSTWDFWSFSSNIYIKSFALRWNNWNF